MKKQKILVVEDEGIIAWDISDKLISIGFEDNQIVSSGLEAIEEVNNFNPDLILMDINLNGNMDGIEAANAIQKDHKIPIIFLTAYSDDITLQRAKMTNPFGYILKPFSIRELNTSIELAFFKYNMNKKLASSEEKYRSLFETSQAGIIIASYPEGKILEHNQRINEMLGNDRDYDVKGKKLSDIYSLNSKFEWLMNAIKNEKKIDQYELKIKLANGSTAWFEGSSWLRNDEKILESVLIDITERKRIEEKLEQSQKMEAIGQIAAGIAHEINTPLAVITTRLEILKEQIEQLKCTKAVNQIDIINKNIYRMSGIIERLLGFSRNKDSEFSLIDPAEILEEVLFFVKTQARKKMIEINFKKTKEHRHLKLHKNKIEQVFLNIIMNAIDAMPEGGILTIEVKNIKTMSQIIFTDTGEGMSDKTIEKIFDPFFTTKKIGKGTGLGMYISYGLIKEMNGEIQIESHVDKGTTITVLLPNNKEK